MKLVVLESPNKVHKVREYLGQDYEVLATAGHFRDLPTDELGVDLTAFAPRYVVDPSKAALLARIRTRAKAASTVLLATDADREGEAIAWHLSQELHLAKPMRLKTTEITPAALRHAAANLVPLDQQLVDAQQARRVLDRLVGYQVSPLLSQYFGRGQSAGRVQSATLHLVVARELERENFRSEPFWTLTATYGQGLKATYALRDKDGRLATARLTTAAEASTIAATARSAQHVVAEVATEPVDTKPAPPFTTSTLQQAASSKLQYQPDHTMALAQRLFEGGHITYHRTDSVALSEDAINMARAFIARDHPAALPDQPVKYRVKSDAQGAHEAIRPTAIEVPPLTGDELALYQLICHRFIACQCKPARTDRTTVTIQAGDTTWKAVGNVLVFDSWRRYIPADTPSRDEAQHDDAGEEVIGVLPALTADQALDLESIDVAAKKTAPPGRYTQASLIAAMERTGIGRPSTYAATVKTLLTREYLAIEKKSIYPTPSGRRIDGALGAAFPELRETETTAQMERRLDEIAEGTRRWKDELRSWYQPFAQRLAAAPGLLATEAKKLPLPPGSAPTASGRPCPRCGRELQLLDRKNGEGQFLACSGYRPADGRPQCTFAIGADAEPFERPCPKCAGATWRLKGKGGAPYARCVGKNECDGRIDLAETASEPCPKCGAAMADRGSFLGCTKYPDCRGTLDKKALKAGRKCPKCGKLLTRRTGAKGPFWGCSGYPECKHLEPIQATTSRKRAGKGAPTCR